MCSCTNSSKQPGCTPASTVIGTPASRRRTAPGANIRPKSISPRANASVYGGRLYGDIADVGEAFRAEQVVRDVMGALQSVFSATPLTTSRRRVLNADPDRGHLRRPFVGQRAPGAEDATGREPRRAGQKIPARLHDLHRSLRRSEPAQAPLLAQAFSSRLSWLKKRQSVPVGEERVRAGLDHADLVEAQRVEAHRVLGVELAPAGEWQLGQRLERVVVALRESTIDQAFARPSPARQRRGRRP